MTVSQVPISSEATEDLGQKGVGRLSIGIDVGGTFTDAILSDGVRTFRAKALTTPDNISDGVLDACGLVAALFGQSLDAVLPSVARFGLGTTAVTNALASRTGRQVGLITTMGFEDSVPTASGRTQSVDGWLVAPWQIVPRRRIIGINERTDREGSILRPIDVAEVLAAARHLIELEKVEAIAVSFLWSYRNPSHEMAAVAAIAQHYPGITVTGGASLLPQIREYERTTLALLNAYTSGALRGVETLEATLQARGMTVPLLLMHSAGGATSVEEARRVPISLAESGPAAGVTAAAIVANDSGYPNAISCDMGGTTLDMAVIAGREPARKNRGEVMGLWTALSLVDVDSVGSGGGSIAWVDALGMMRVGPRSAGAMPGPASYGRGGSSPTVTDALLVAGYIDGERFLGGAMPLDREAARAACVPLAAQLDLGVDEFAWGVRAIALADMVKAVRSRIIERGLNPQDHAFVSYGGCGGLFTADIARAIGSPTVLFPEFASVLSAFGAAVADIRREHIRSLGIPVTTSAETILETLQGLSEQVWQDLAADGVAEEDRSVTFEADLRFRRQRWELTIPLDQAAEQSGNLDNLVERFKEEYARRYGPAALVAGMPVELTSLRAIGLGRTVKAALNRRAAREGLAPARSERWRMVKLDRLSEPTKVAVLDAQDLADGSDIIGPALIDASDTTIWIPPHSTARIDERNTLVLEIEK